MTFYFFTSFLKLYCLLLLKNISLPEDKQLNYQQYKQINPKKYY